MDAFKDASIVPDIIDEIPALGAEVIYPTGGFLPGDSRTPSQVKDEPKVTWAGEQDALYTLACIDPDLPEEYRYFLHWLVVNIPECDVSKGDHHAPYMGSAPPKGSGVHRYIFLVFKQSGKLELTDPPRVTPPSIEGRMQFNMKQWLTKYGLDAAIAGTFFKAEHEEPEAAPEPAPEPEAEPTEVKPEPQRKSRQCTIV